MAPRTEREWIDLTNRVGAVFTPTAPISDRDLFAGRTREIERVIDAVLQTGQHAMIFGERGVGKTSLGNVLSQYLGNPRKTVIAPIVNCVEGETFDSLWRKVLNRIELVQERPTIGISAPDTTTTYSATSLVDLDQSLSPDAIHRALDLISEAVLLIVILDEFDRLARKPRRQFADFVKTLSDHQVPATLVLIGVAESVDQLIDAHQSVARALVQIPMPRMADAEIRGIVTTGLAALEMEIAADALAHIGFLAQGFPHYAHLIGRHAARAAIAARSLVVTLPNVQAAVDAAIMDAQRSILSAYHAATASSRKDNLFADVLLACALAETDEMGTFAARSVREHLCGITGKNLAIASFAQHLSDFSDAKRQNILAKTGVARRFRYRFSDPLMRPFVVMKGLQAGRITPAHIVTPL